jgi:hypothetical protein
MKQLFLCLLLLVPVLPLHAQQQWRVVLASGETYHDATLEALHGDTLLLREKRRAVSVDLRDLVRLRRTIRSGATTGAWIGAGVGVGMTVATYVLSRRNSHGDAMVGAAMIILVPVTGGLGAFLGGALGQFDRDEEVHELSSMPLTEKGMLVEEILARRIEN